MTSLARKRETYKRLWLICEIYRPEWKATLERARHRTGIDGPKKERIHQPPIVLPLGLMTTWRQQGMTPQEIAAKVAEMNELRKAA